MVLCSHNGASHVRQPGYGDGCSGGCKCSGLCLCRSWGCVCTDQGGVPLGGASWLGSLGRDIVILGKHPVFVLNLVAYCPIQGAFGAYTFWGPKVSIKLPR